MKAVEILVIFSAIFLILGMFMPVVFKIHEIGEKNKIQVQARQNKVKQMVDKEVIIESVKWTVLGSQSEYMIRLVDDNGNIREMEPDAVEFLIKKQQKAEQ